MRLLYVYPPIVDSSFTTLLIQNMIKSIRCFYDRIAQSWFNGNLQTGEKMFASIEITKRSRFIQCEFSFWKKKFLTCLSAINTFSVKGLTNAKLFNLNKNFRGTVKEVSLFYFLKYPQVF